MRYGEPWGVAEQQIRDRMGCHVLDGIDANLPDDHIDRIVACVNACRWLSTTDLGQVSCVNDLYWLCAEKDSQ